MWLVAGMYLGNWQFEVPWTKTELETLSSAIADMINAFGGIGIDWQETPLPGTRYKKTTTSGPWANPLTKIVTLRSVKDQTIWHESAHILAFRSLPSLKARYASESGNCTSIGSVVLTCSLTAKEGYYYRDYGYDAGAFQGRLYGVFFNLDDTWSDAFAAWVYHQTNISGPANPTSWIDNSVSGKQIVPAWQKIYDAVEVALAVFK
jgi:hypothetical protein